MDRMFSNLGASGPDGDLQRFEVDSIEFIMVRVKQNKLLAKGYSIAQLLEKDLRDNNYMNLMRHFMSDTMQDPDIKKSDEEALKCKESGNRQYKFGHFKEALQYYNDGIVLGTSFVLAVVFSNRSAVLFTMNEFNKCLTDIERALSYECKDSLKLKLFMRRAKCFLKLKQIDDTVKSVESVESWLQSADVPEGMKTETKKELSNIRDEIRRSGAVSKEDHSTSEPKLSYGPNVGIPPLSAAVNVKYREDKGRYAVANRPLRVGDVVLVEKPYVCAIDGNYKMKFPNDDCCNNCVAYTLMSTVPCPHCSQVRYCSEDCRDESWRKHHYMECGYSAYTTVLALRMLLAAGVENVISMKEELEKRPDYQLPGFNANGEFEPEKYYSVYHLSQFDANSDLEFKARTVNVCVHSLTYLEEVYKLKIDTLEMDDQLRQTRKTNLEGPNGSCFTWEERLFLANILARNLLISKFTTTTLFKDCLLPSDISPLRSVELTHVGSAIHPAYSSFLNHSCDPNLGLFTVASTVIVSVIRDVKQGEELCMNYGPRRYLTARDERRAELLKNFGFTCKCAACEDGNGIQDISFLDLRKNFPSSIPNLLSGASQDLIVNTLRLTYKFLDAVSKMGKHNYPAALMLYNQCLKLVESEQENSNIKLSKLFWEIHDMMLNCMEEKLVPEINDESSGKESFRNFDGTLETRTRPRNLELLLDVLDHCLESLPDFESTQGLEADSVADYNLNYFRLLVRMDWLRRDGLRRNARWRSLAKRGLEFLSVMKNSKPKTCGDLDAFRSGLNDLNECLNKCVNG